MENIYIYDDYNLTIRFNSMCAGTMPTPIAEPISEPIAEPISEQSITEPISKQPVYAPISLPNTPPTSYFEFLNNEVPCKDCCRNNICFDCVKICCIFGTCCWWNPVIWIIFDV